LKPLNFSFVIRMQKAALFPAWAIGSRRAAGGNGFAQAFLTNVAPRDACAARKPKKRFNFYLLNMNFSS
jgi:hypothetical protein